MNLNNLYDLTEKENINVYNWYIDDCKGLYMNYKGSNSIALNYNNICTSAEEKCTLSEELGHYYTRKRLSCFLHR